MTKEIQPWASDEGADLFPHEVQSCSAFVVASVARTHTHTHTHTHARARAHPLGSGETLPSSHVWFHAFNLYWFPSPCLSASSLELTYRISVLSQQGL